ncbi:hypothetical protein J2S25_002544 [Mesobacillus stamsii]|uniref:Core-binding (CB) domain-containing protein n=1 Tax=Mesobacillus stamsii TaxID=225347 RepID=A0ABU0FWM0_9BACI|nr:hypothetical protein [Mesobacillus stamsii]
MTLFTADGLIWAYDRMRERGIGSFAGSGTYQSYLRWLYTQTKSLLDPQPHEVGSSILQYKELYSARAPGNTCLSALESNKKGTIEKPINNSKGCGGVMRLAPVGLFYIKTLSKLSELLRKSPRSPMAIRQGIRQLDHWL